MVKVKVKIETGVGLGDEVPALHRFEIIVPGGGPAGRCNQRWCDRLVDIDRYPLQRGGRGEECDDAQFRPAVGADQRQRVEQANQPHRPEAVSRGAEASRRDGGGRGERE